MEKTKPSPHVEFVTVSGEFKWLSDFPLPPDWDYGVVKIVEQADETYYLVTLSNSYAN